MTAVKHFFLRHRFLFGLFAFLILYEILIGNRLSPWIISDDFYVFYTVDFRMGFCSRLLPGAIYHLFFPAPDMHTVSVYVTALTVILLAGVCIFLEKLLMSTARNNKLLCLFFILLFLTGPASFSFFVTGLGVMDLYWALFTLLFFVFFTHKRLYFLIPPLFALCVFVHYGAMICYIPLMAILLLYKISVTQEKSQKKALLVVFSLSVFFAFAGTIYVMLFEEKMLVYTMEEFDSIIRSRGAKLFYYYDYEFYKKVDERLGGSSYVNITETNNLLLRLIRHAIAQAETTFTQNFKNGDVSETVLSISVMIPLAGTVFSVLWKRLFDPSVKNGLRRFAISLIPMLFLLMLGCAVLFSTDTFRWLSHMFLCLLIAFFYISVYEGEQMWADVRRVTNRLPFSVLALYFVLFAALSPTAA